MFFDGEHVLQSNLFSNLIKLIATMRNATLQRFNVMLQGFFQYAAILSALVQVKQDTAGLCAASGGASHRAACGVGFAFLLGIMLVSVISMLLQINRYFGY